MNYLYCGKGSSDNATQYICGQCKYFLLFYYLRQIVEDSCFQWTKFGLRIVLLQIIVQSFCIFFQKCHHIHVSTVFLLLSVMSVVYIQFIGVFLA